VKVASVSDLTKSPMKRIHVRVQNRNVSLMQVDDRIYCMDSVCSHMGGPLAVGDIEDLAGEKVIKCPWHSYRFSLEDGKKFSKPVSFDPQSGSPLTHPWKKSDEVYQRTHEVRLDQNGDIRVKLSIESEAELPSDRYAYDNNAAACMNTACSQYFHSKRY